MPVELKRIQQLHGWRLVGSQSSFSHHRRRYPQITARSRNMVTTSFEKGVRAKNGGDPVFIIDGDPRLWEAIGRAQCTTPSVATRANGGRPDASETSRIQPRRRRPPGRPGTSNPSRIRPHGWATSKSNGRPGAALVSGRVAAMARRAWAAGRPVGNPALRTAAGRYDKLGPLIYWHDQAG